MEYRDRAISAVKSAEKSLRGELRPIILEAIAADAYADVAAIARIAGALSTFLGNVSADTYSEEASARPSLGELLDKDLTPLPLRHDREPARTAKAGSRRDKYPRFLRDGDRLVKVAWSKKERAPYEHRAPSTVIQALISAVLKKKGDEKLFQAADVLPLKNASNEEFPSYQSYLALSWLRDVGVVTKKGRDGYVMKARAANAETLEELWASLPATNEDVMDKLVNQSAR